MSFPIYQVIFYVFAVVTLISALMVITSRDPVRAVLFLVLAFFASAILWLLLQIEFLSLVLLFVYVGAVMTLFLFVVMMLNPKLTVTHEKFVKHLPLVLVLVVAFVGMMVWAISVHPVDFAREHVIHHAANYSNTRQLGQLLFTHYNYPFELAGLILLVAIVAAISLAFHGKGRDRKNQRISEQHKANKQSRLDLL